MAFAIQFSKTGWRLGTREGRRQEERGYTCDPVEGQQKKAGAIKVLVLSPIGTKKREKFSYSQ
jgi:hypothetical protein